MPVVEEPGFGPVLWSGSRGWRMPPERLQWWNAQWEALCACVEEGRAVSLLDLDADLVRVQRLRQRSAF